MQYQKQAKLKAEQVIKKKVKIFFGLFIKFSFQEKLYKEQEAKKREDEAKQARLLSRK